MGEKYGRYEFEELQAAAVVTQYEVDYTFWNVGNYKLE